MLNRFIWASAESARKKASLATGWTVFVRDTASGFITTAHHMLMVLGFVAIAALAIMFVKPDAADHLKALSPFAEAEASESELATLMDSAHAQSVTPSSNMKAVLKVNGQGPLEQQWVTSWLSRRYRVATDATGMLVSAAYLTAAEIKLDPLLILSVMAIESRFNPFAESPVGAQGLMQVMSKVHQDKFEDHGGVKAALNPVANIKVGSLILKEYVRRGGSVEAGLKLYVGAGALDTDFGYGSKVLAEYRRLKDVAMGKKVPIYSTSVKVAAPKQAPKPQAVDENLGEPTQPLANSDQVAAL
ncbi:MAG TPA: lytic transglycosylase domain-containing protein [Noviherbaspirillum sp.]|nr:lytic transglycosylase domain-containing protein [Noviherbaspirillum sp.]